MRKKELEKEIIRLDKKIDDLRRSLSISEETIHFLTRYNRDEVVVSADVAEWIYDGEIKRAFADRADYLRYVVENNCKYAIIKSTNIFLVTKYFKLDKSNGNLMDITDIYHEKVDGETQSTAEQTEEKCDCKCKKGGKE